MRTLSRVLVPLLLFAAGTVVLTAGDVVVIKGGARIELQKPMVRQGDVVLLTRSDGTLLSVRATDVDWKATAAAAKAAPAKAASPAWATTQTPAEAARSSREGPKARVKLTDADVSHVPNEEAAAGKKDEHPASGRLEVVEYEQEKSGGNLAVHGSLRNATATPATNARMTVTAMDEKGEKIASGEAILSNGLVESGATVSFSATVPVGEKFVGSIRFNPQWIVQPPPGPPPTPAGPAVAGARPAPRPNPAPVPTPYGMGNLYAAPAPSASTTPPADGKTGYLPNISSPENQPKPPQ